jgi:hypothetical protein
VEPLKLPYQPYYCEENAYKSCEVLAGRGYRRPAMVFVFGRSDWVMMFQQRAAPPGEPIWWDYHVFPVAVDESGVTRVFDPDSRHSLAVPWSRYRITSFADEADVRFRVLRWETAQAAFGSDRRHMRRANGDWIKPPPPWPPINPSRHTLPLMLSEAADAPGAITSGAALVDGSDVG